MIPYYIHQHNFTTAYHEDEDTTCSCKLQHMPQAKFWVAYPVGYISYLVVQHIFHATASVTEEEYTCAVGHSTTNSQIHCSQKLGLEVCKLKNEVHHSKMSQVPSAITVVQIQGYKYSSEEASHDEMYCRADVDKWSQNEETPMREPQKVCTLSRKGAIFTQEVSTVW